MKVGPFWIVAGLAWIVLVLWVSAFALDQAGRAAAEGTIPEPSTARVAVAWLSAVVFSLPGGAFVVAGVRRLRRSLRGGRPGGP